MAEEIVEGALVAGEDGAMFWIPKDDLEAYRLPDEQADDARSRLESDDDVSAFGWNVSSFSQSSPMLASFQTQNLQVFKTVYGPIGRFNPADANMPTKVG
jgi:hypothetical protein